MTGTLLDKDRLRDELGLDLTQADALAFTLLANAEGYGDVGTMLSDAVMDSVVPGWCKTCNQPGGDCEPDARANWCEHCGEMGVESCLSLAGMI